MTAPKHLAWMPPDCPVHILIALQAIERGEANPDQQRQAMKWIIEDLCRTYDISFRPEGDRDTVFAEGRRFVGLMIVEKLRLHAGTMRRLDERIELSAKATSGTKW